MHTATDTRDEILTGTVIAFGATLIGRVLGVVRDPLSQRVRRLVTSYGLHGRRVAVPIDWVVRRTPTRVTLAVGTRELDDLAEYQSLGLLPSGAHISRANGAAL